MLKSSYRDNLKWVHVRIGLFFSRFGLTPNMWTLLSLIPAVAGFICLIYDRLALALMSFVVSAFIDIIDGNVARVTKSVSNLGAFADGVMDRYVEFALYLGLYFYLVPVEEVLAPHSFWILLLTFSALMPSFITAYADHRNVVKDDNILKNMGGLVERFERLSILYTGMFLGLFNPLYLVYSIILVVLLSNATAFWRIFKVVENS